MMASTSTFREVLLKEPVNFCHVLEVFRHLSLEIVNLLLDIQLEFELVHSVNHIVRNTQAPQRAARQHEAISAEELRCRDKWA